jgi:hypothetical protein
MRNIERARTGLRAAHGGNGGFCFARLSITWAARLAWCWPRDLVNSRDGATEVSRMIGVLTHASPSEDR